MNEKKNRCNVPGHGSENYALLELFKLFLCEFKCIGTVKMKANFFSPVVPLYLYSHFLCFKPPTQIAFAVPFQVISIQNRSSSWGFKYFS